MLTGHGPTARQRRRGHQRDQVQRVTRPRVHRLDPRCPLHLNGGAVSYPVGDRHQPVDPDLPDPTAQGLQQASGELRAHRPPELHPGQGGGQVEGLSLADRNGQMPVLRHRVKHNAERRVLLRRGDPDDLAEPHFHETGVLSCCHDQPSSMGHHDHPGPPAPERQAGGRHFRCPARAAVSWSA
jgi:hypothetical protein